MDIFSFTHTPDPTKVKVVERERREDEPWLLLTTFGRTVPLLPVTPDRAESELEASVDKLFDEGGSGNQAEQGDSAGGGGGVNIQPTVETTDTVIEVVAPVQPKCQRKKKTVDVDAGESSHPPKKLREDHRTLSGAFVGGKSRSAIQRLLAGDVLNAEVRGEVIPTLPFVTSSVSATSKRESGVNVTEAEVDSLVRSIVPIMTTVTTVVPTVDSYAIAKEKTINPSLFGTFSSSAGGTDPTPSGFSDCTGSDFLVGGIRTIVDPDYDLQKVYIPQWNITNGSCRDDGGICCGMFTVGAARQMSLSAEVRMRAAYNIKERRRLTSVVKEKDVLLKARDEEIENLKAQLLLKEAEATEAIRLCTEASKFEAIKKSLLDEVEALKELNTTPEKEKNDLDVKVTDLTASVAVREREVADLDAQLTSVKFQNDNLIDQVYELGVSSARLQEKVTVYDNCMEQLKKFQDD
ncbi:hypothetical protein Tco_1433705 [Tanacetum coccineum]